MCVCVRVQSGNTFEADDGWAGRSRLDDALSGGGGGGQAGQTGDGVEPLRDFRIIHNSKVVI